MEIIDSIIKRSKRANLKWILGNAIGEGRAIIFMMFEVHEDDYDNFKSALNDLKNMKEVENILVEENQRDIGLFAPSEIGLEFMEGNARVVMLTTDFLERLVETIVRGGDPVITSLIGTVLYRTAYYRGFNMAENLKNALLIEGIDLVEATLLQLKASGFYTNFLVEGDEELVSVQFYNLALTPKLRTDNPLVVGAVAGIVDSSFGGEYRVKVVESREMEDGYYARLEAKPLEGTFEEEKGKGGRGSSGFLRRTRR